MTTQLNQDLVDRLVCAKYMFCRSCELLDRGGPFSSGMAVSGFQDAVELVLRTIAEHLNVSLKDGAAFNQIIDAIDDVGPDKVPQRSSLNQLNKARVNFKHFGLEPKEQDARKFRRDLETFFPVALRQFFRIGFEDVSLINIIGHRRTQNHLHRAENLIEQEDYQGAVTECAIAYAAYRLHVKSERYHGFDLDTFGHFRRSEMKGLLDAVKRAFEQQQDQIDVLMDGLNPADFKRFERLTPQVSFSMARTVWVDYPMGARIVPDREAALFCLRFAVDSILIMKENPDLRPGSIKPSGSRLKIVKRVPAIVWPVKSGDVEVIRDVEVGEIFYGNDRPEGDHVHIVLDGDPAFIDRDAVEFLPPEKEGP